MFSILVVALLVFLLLLGLPVGAAFAHEGGPLAPGEFWAAWNWDPLILLSIFIPAWLYLRGIRSLWQKAGQGRAVGGRYVAAFMVGLAALFIALISPLDALAVTLFSAHMVQHLLLIMVAAPLLVLGAPPAAQAWSIPASWRVGIGRWWHRQTFLETAWRGLSNPWFAWSLHALAVTLWHIPLFYQAALVNEFVHFLEHASFFFSALLFWLVVFRTGQRGKLSHGASMLYVFSMMMYQGLLGALITFSRSAWYPLYEERVQAWGLTLLEDQQLAGAIMWVPGNFVYLVAFIWLLWEWFQVMERKDNKVREAALRSGDQSKKSGENIPQGDVPSA